MGHEEFDMLPWNPRRVLKERLTWKGPPSQGWSSDLGELSPLTTEKVLGLPKPELVGSLWASREQPPRVQSRALSQDLQRQWGLQKAWLLSGNPPELQVLRTGAGRMPLGH